MKISDFVVEKIKKENNFSIELAKILEVKQRSVINLAKRKSKNLTLWDAIMFYKKMGLSEEEIFQDYIKEEEEREEAVDKKNKKDRIKRYLEPD